jgi:hypothetical protein
VTGFFFPYFELEVQMKNKFLLVAAILLFILSISACGSNPPAATVASANQPENPAVSQASPPPAYAVPSPNAPGSNPAPVVVTTKDNPAPVGSAVLVDNMNIVVIGKVRPADSLVAKGNMFTDTPAAGQEYMFVTISASCEQATDKQCNFDTYNFKTLGTDGVVKDFKQVTAIDGLLKYTTFNGGSTLTGILSFLVAQNDTKILLVYQPSSGDSSYLAIP